MNSIAHPYFARLHRLVLMLTLGLMYSAAGAQTFAPGIDVKNGEITLRDAVYYLDARVDFNLNDIVREALESGVPLTFELEIELVRPRMLLWNEEVATLSQRYSIRYHALSDRYVLTNLNSAERSSFLDAEGALDALGRIEDLPLVDRRLVDGDESYEVWLRARLDLDELPRPLRTVAYITPEWRLVSDWKLWQFKG